MKKTKLLQLQAWGIVIGLLLLALVIRFAIPSNRQPFDHIDAARFDQIARNILENDTFSHYSEPPLCEESVRTPLYPYFLATIYQQFGHNTVIVFIIQSLLDLLAAAVVFRLAYAFCPRNRFWASVLALICYTFSLSQSRFSNEILSEGLLTPLLALSVFFLWRALRTSRHRGVIGAAFFLGLSILCKPNVQILLLVFALVFTLASRIPVKQRIKLAVIFSTVAMVTLAPWIIRNRVVFGEFFLSHTYQDNIARVSAVSTLAEIQGEQIKPWTNRWEKIYGTLVEQAAIEYNWSGNPVPSCEERRQHHADVAAVAVDVVSQHPAKFVIAHLKPVIYGLLPQEQFYWYEEITGKSSDSSAPEDATTIQRLLKRPPLLLVMWGVWLAGYALSYIGVMAGLLLLSRRSYGMLIVMVSLILIGFFLPGPLVYARFRAPIVPYLIVLYTSGLLHLATKLNKKKQT